MLKLGKNERMFPIMLTKLAITPLVNINYSEIYQRVTLEKNLHYFRS